MPKYTVPVFVTTSGHLVVEVPGPDTPEARKQALEAAKEAYDGRDSVEDPSTEVDFAEDPDDVELLEEDG